MSKDIEITLTEDESCVLFEFVRKFSDSDRKLPLHLIVTIQQWL